MRARLALCFMILAISLTAAPAFAADVFINGLKATSLKLAEMLNCTVKFDGDGNIHILSPGYNVEADKDGNPKLVGMSDLVGNPVSSANQGKTKNRYVLVYQPNVKVMMQLEVFVNGQSFKRIGLTESGFTIDLTQELRPGYNDIRVKGKVDKSPIAGTEMDVAMIKVLTGREVEGKFLAKSPPLWEFARSSIDLQPVDRVGRFVAE
jgi:hypothetical protein